MATFPRYANCEMCDWDGFFRDEELAEAISVLHVLVKHPVDYEQATGKDPDQAAAAYAGMISKYRNIL